MVDLPTRALLYSIFVLGVACVTVALLGTYLAESLRHAGKQLQEAAVEVADLRELNQVIVDSIQSGLMTTDAEGRILYVNQFAEAILGRSPAGLRGTAVREVLGSPLLGPAELARARRQPGAGPARAVLPAPGRTRARARACR